ncbi:hypothetical protein [Lentilactobacillus sp. SPB1-3]|uniref:Uncharacterized protein n=1 Tax=Lentilactobacillus terminaliae TaxID=3003483 RepID=A0ACD5DCY3_9LACO|nr:hypothetical protein [Lentilactobacillus sp. SPB1-3]MCZ0978015.1 hypothetical protein [Lentilactobacillus sp. SPB1-3]
MNQGLMAWKTVKKRKGDTVTVDGQDYVLIEDPIIMEDKKERTIIELEARDVQDET